MPTAPYRVAVTVLTTPTQLLGSSPRRKRVILSAPQVNRYSVSFLGPATLDQDTTIYPGQPPVVL